MTFDVVNRVMLPPVFSEGDLAGLKDFLLEAFLLRLFFDFFIR